MKQAYGRTKKTSGLWFLTYVLSKQRAKKGKVFGSLLGTKFVKFFFSPVSPIKFETYSMVQYVLLLNGFTMQLFLTFFSTDVMRLY